VLDEADRMFDLGFIKDIRYLFRRMPPPQDRLNMLFSATLSFRVMELAYEHMNNPVEVKIESESRVADKIEEFCFYPADDEKSPLLINMLKKFGAERSLVFVNTRHAVESVAATLEANGISCAALSGEVPQKKRERLLQEFKDGKKNVLVATDVAARGLHIPAVSHVYNYDLPQDAEDYVHRIGRTARAGASGEAISFLCEKYAYSIMDIEDYIGHSIEKRTIEPWMLEAIEVGKVRRSDKSRSKRGSKPDRSSRAKQSRGPARDKEKDRNNTESDSTPVADAGSLTDSTEPPIALSQNTKEETSPSGADGEEPAVSQDSVATTAAPAIEESAPPTADAAISKSQSDDAADDAVPLPINRFSRKFGEIPLVG